VARRSVGTADAVATVTSPTVSPACQWPTDRPPPLCRVLMGTSLPGSTLPTKFTVSAEGVASPSASSQIARSATAAVQPPNIPFIAS
jgi:hypothetical protein